MRPLGEVSLLLTYKAGPVETCVSQSEKKTQTELQRIFTST